jgi:hypothetical protein
MSPNLSLNVVNWQLLSPLISAIIGGFVVHLFSARRDHANKRREYRVGYLIEAYRRLEACSHGIGPDNRIKLESAVADIQLLGTPNQVDLVQKFARDFAAQSGVSLDVLLQDLRADLRAELRLEPVPKGLVYLRITGDGKA